MNYNKNYCKDAKGKNRHDFLFKVHRTYIKCFRCFFAKCNILCFLSTKKFTISSIFSLMTLLLNKITSVERMLSLNLPPSPHSLKKTFDDVPSYLGDSRTFCGRYFVKLKGYFDYFVSQMVETSIEEEVSFGTLKRRCDQIVQFLFKSGENLNFFSLK